MRAPGTARFTSRKSRCSTQTTWNSRARSLQSIRTARNRAGKEGVTAQWTSWAELDVETREKIFALSEQWMSDKALPEMGFTLGSVDELSVEGTKL